MMTENIDPEALPSTSQSSEIQNMTIIPLVSLPKVILTRLDLKNLPVPVSPSTSPVKKSVKRLTNIKSKTVGSKAVLKKVPVNLKHEKRTRGRPKKNYKVLSEIGTSLLEDSERKTPTGKIGGIVKKVRKFTSSEEDNSVKGMLKKTMLQKRSKIAIPPAKKPKLMPAKVEKKNVVPTTSKKENYKTTALIQKKVSQKIKNSSFQMDTDASEDEFLYDELIDELVNVPDKKPAEKRTNITLKPNVGNKPPTIVKGGIVKKSSLPPDLKSVANPTTLNSNKLTGTALNSKSKNIAVEHTTKTPDTAESPKANLPIKASPFPITINPSPSKAGPKDQGKKGQKKSIKSTSVINEGSPLNTSTSLTIQTKISPKPKSPTSAPRPRGRPRLGPKPSVVPSPVKIAADDDSDEYTEIETLENIDLEPEVSISNAKHIPSKNEDIELITVQNSDGSVKSNTNSSKINSNDDADPHLDLLRILTGDTEDAQSEKTELREVISEKPNNHEESLKPNTVDTPNKTPESSEESSNNDTISRGIEKEESGVATDELEIVQNEERITGPITDTEIPSGSAAEEAPPVRTVYDLMNDVSLKYPSWNLHIIPETNAFCIAQVTKGRLGLPTLKKCIELDADTYNAKVYIHQYHIKRFDGVYDSEEAIVALIEEIHSIKA